MSTFIFSPDELENNRISRSLHTALILDSASGVKLSNLEIAELKHLDYRDPVEGYTSFLNDLKLLNVISSYEFIIPEAESDSMNLKLHCIQNSRYTRIIYTFKGDYSTQLVPIYRLITKEYLYKL